METRFGLLFLDMLDGLVSAFPKCRHTKKIHQWIQLNPDQLPAIKLDWARMITPYKILSFNPTIHYFERIQKELPDHLFNLVKLHDKYHSMKGDKQAQDDLCSVLADLEIFSLVDDTAVGIVEEPDTPTSDTKDLTQNNNENDQKQSKNRFDDPVLFNLCIEKTQNEPYCRQLRDVARNLSVLSEMFGKESNEAIANQVAKMQTVVSPLLQMFSCLPLQSLPLDNIISMVARETMNMTTPRNSNSNVSQSQQSVKYNQ